MPTVTPPTHCWPADGWRILSVDTYVEPELARALMSQVTPYVVCTKVIPGRSDSTRASPEQEKHDWGPGPLNRSKSINVLG